MESNGIVQQDTRSTQQVGRVAGARVPCYINCVSIHVAGFSPISTLKN